MKLENLNEFEQEWRGQTQIKTGPKGFDLFGANKTDDSRVQSNQSAIESKTDSRNSESKSILSKIFSWFN